MTDLLDDALAAQLGRPLYDAINKHLADGQRAEAEAQRLRLMVDEYGTGASALSDKLGEARETNRRLNHEKQRLESELAAYRRAISTWEFTEHGTYVPLRSITAMAKAAGVGYDATRYELHYERVERAEAQLTAVADLIADHEGDEWAAHPATTALRGILDGEEYAIARPGTAQANLLVTVTAPDPANAVRWAGHVRDLVHAEFDGSMRLHSFIELEPGARVEPDFTGPLTGIEVRDPCPFCESSPSLIPRTLMAGHVATVHPEVQTLDTTAEQRARTTVNNPPGLREQLRAAIESEIYEYRERTMFWEECGGVTQEIARLATRGAMEVLDGRP